MAYNDPRDRVAPYFATPQEGELAPQPALLPVGWEAARHYHRLKKTLAPGRARVRSREVAIDAVLERARAVGRHQSRPQRVVLSAWGEAPGAELDLEASIESSPLLEAEHLHVSHREPWEAQLCLILDMSLSMTGEKIALMAVAAAVMGLTLGTRDLAVVAFDTVAHTLLRWDEEPPIRGFVGRLLDFPAQGYTCMEAGLRAGLALLREAPGPEKAAILITDGVYNVGWDPIPLAPRFPHLHVVKIGEGDQDKGLCRRLAAGGRGRLLVAPGFEELAEVCGRLVRELARG